GTLKLDFCPFWGSVKLRNPVNIGSWVFIETPPVHGLFQKPLEQNRAPNFRRCKARWFWRSGSLLRGQSKTGHNFQHVRQESDLLLWIAKQMGTSRRPGSKTGS